MDKQNASIRPTSPQSASYQRHRRQKFWQILAPVIFSGLLVLAVVVLMILSITGVKTGIAVSQWADTSLIWMLLPVIFLAIIMSLILFVMIYGLARLLRILPSYTGLIQGYVRRYATVIGQGSQKVLTPIIKMKSYRAGMSAVFSSLFRRSGK